jgi:hypothetical protein
VRDEPVQRPMQVFDQNRSIAAVGVRPSTAATAHGAGGRAVPTPFPIWLGVALFGLAVALPLFRQTGTQSWRTIWAEDGSIYFQQAYQHGWLAVLFRGFAERVRHGSW